MSFSAQKLAAGLCAAAILCAGAASAGTVTGTVKYEGEIPKMRPLDMAQDPICHAKHEGEQKVNEALVLGDGQTMGNVYVRVTGGLPEGQQYPVPTEPMVLNQEGCIYTPHVFAVRLGQPLKVLNPDGTMHNVNMMSEVNKPQNLGMPKNRTEMELNFEKVEDMFPIKCDVHPWMRSYAAVIDHPYFSITQKDGIYKIEGLPAGEYEITAWHEVPALKAETVKVTVPADGEVTQDFTFVRPKKAE